MIQHKRIGKVDTMRVLDNVIKETKKQINTIKSFDFIDGMNTLAIGEEKARLIDHTPYKDSDDIPYKCYAVFKLTWEIRDAIYKTILESFKHTITHNVLCERIPTVGTLSDEKGIRKNVEMEVTIAYDPRCRARVLYIWDCADKENSMPVLGIELKVDTLRNYSQCICNLQR